MKIMLLRLRARLRNTIKVLLMLITRKPRASSRYIMELPSAQNALNLFKDSWVSKMPPPHDNLEAGSIASFADNRIEWAEQQLGGFRDRKILELGPLEGGHTYMLEKAGASSIIAIEANTAAYLKCLITKEILNLKKSRILLGDFNRYLEETNEHFDICIAVGVLYHMTDPVNLLHLIAQHANAVFLSTHYYDENVIQTRSGLAQSFGKGETRESHGFRYKAYKYTYSETLDWTKFLGGSAAYSNWLERETIVSCLTRFGFEQIQIGLDDPDHVHGPSFALIGTKPPHPTSR